MAHLRGDTGGATPSRIAARPDPDGWGLDELLTYAEAAALHWPDGPLTARSLRTAADDGRLPVVVIARKKFTSRRAVQEMCRCAPTNRKPDLDAPSPTGQPGESPDDGAYGRLMRKLREPKG